MEKQIIELPVEQLRIGVYVSRLDRSWIGTPFLFQGFEVESEDDLKQLRSLCKTVYVEITAAEAEELLSAGERKPVPAQDPAPHREDVLAELSQDLMSRLSSVPMKDSVPLKTELAKAKTTYGEARQAVGQIFDKLRRGGALDVPYLDTVVDSMVDSVFRNRDAICWLAHLKSKDDYLYSHSLSTSVWALAFGRHLGLDKDTLKSLGTGAMLLDIGKTKLPTELLKKRAALNDQEWQQVHLHVHHGVELIRSMPTIDSRIVTMLATHHERYDGSGYPNKLVGEQIPLIGRIAGIVDTYDAMTSERSFARAKSTYDAVRELKRLSGTLFPKELVELFIQAVGVFPTGTLVQLNTGEVGVVISQNRFRRLRPEVMLILDADKKLRKDFASINLQSCEENSSRNTALWITHGLEPGAYGIDPTEYFL